MSAPMILTFVGTTNGSSSSYPPGSTYIVTGPPKLASATLRACLSVLNGPLG